MDNETLIKDSELLEQIPSSPFKQDITPTQFKLSVNLGRELAWIKTALNDGANEARVPNNHYIAMGIILMMRISAKNNALSALKLKPYLDLADKYLADNKLTLPEV